MTNPQTAPHKPAPRKKSRTLFHDVWDFLRERKAWWLVPIAIVLSFMGVLIVASSVPYLAPFIYALF
jgi:hypothetical protein